MKGELRNEETYRRRETDWLRRPCVGTDGDDVSVASVSGETTIQAGMQMQFSATVKTTQRRMLSHGAFQTILLRIQKLTKTAC